MKEYFDWPPSAGDEQQPRQGWAVNQPKPTALREILMLTRQVRQQLDAIEAAVRRMENM